MYLRTCQPTICTEVGTVSRHFGAETKRDLPNARNIRSSWHVPMMLSPFVCVCMSKIKKIKFGMALSTIVSGTDYRYNS